MKMTIFDVLTMIGGLCLFLFGMNVMGDGLERRAGNSLKILLAKLTDSKFKGFLTGLGVTAVIQSSSATTVMVVGFVNSRLMTLKQSIGVIMGANIGTTVTAWILSLGGISSDNLFMQLLKPTSFTPVLALIGTVFLMFSKESKRKDVGTILLGFATLMFGMDTMSDAVSGLADIPAFQNLFLMFENPILGVLVGAVLTGIIQSSSASVGILQALSATGAAQALQNAHRCRRGLDDGRQHRTEHNAQQRVGEGDHQIGKPRFTLQERHRAGHQVHTRHQGHEAKTDGTDPLLLFALAEHIKNDTGNGDQGCQGGRLEQLDDKAVTLQTGQGQDPCSDGGADVGAHDNTDRLLQGHNAGVDKAHHHDGGCRGGLDHRRNTKAQQKALEHVGTHPCQNGLQLAAGLPLQGLAHDIHTEQEQSQATQQGDDLKKIRCHAFLLYDTFLL